MYVVTSKIISYLRAMIEQYIPYCVMVVWIISCTIVTRRNVLNVTYVHCSEACLLM